MIGQEGQPTFGGITTPPDAAVIPGHGPSRYDEAQLQEFAVNLRCPPSRILFGYASDQRPDFSCGFRSAAARWRPPFPEESKSGPVPGDYGFRFHHN
jgi:hypothetical protein